jgi:hypothetical protein
MKKKAREGLGFLTLTRVNYIMISAPWENKLNKKLNNIV